MGFGVINEYSLGRNVSYQEDLLFCPKVKKGILSQYYKMFSISIQTNKNMAWLKIKRVLPLFFEAEEARVGRRKQISLVESKGSMECEALQVRQLPVCTNHI